MPPSAHQNKKVAPAWSDLFSFGIVERLVQRYGEPDLPDVGIGVRVLHSVAVPVRSDARVVGDTNVVAHAENRTATGFSRAAESGRARSNRPNSHATGEEKTTVRLGVEPNASVDFVDSECRALIGLRPSRRAYAEEESRRNRAAE